MMIDAVQLLRKLTPPIRPVTGRGADDPAAPLEDRSFGELLALVADGEVRSQCPVSLDFEPRTPVSDDQLGRMSGAADMAAAHGAEKALMLIDGRGLVLDVTGRTLIAELGERDDDPIVALDAAVFIADGAAAQRVVGCPGPGLAPRAVAEQIARAFAARMAAPPSPVPAGADPAQRPGD
jgi:hypothetical protein